MVSYCGVLRKPMKPAIALLSVSMLLAGRIGFGTGVVTHSLAGDAAAEAAPPASGVRKFHLQVGRFQAAGVAVGGSGLE